MLTDLARVWADLLTTATFAPGARHRSPSEGRRERQEIQARTTRTGRPQAQAGGAARRWSVFGH
ncbi:MAG: hypothetical protein U1E45_05560 [Geminicoccaceae bacterium]